MRLIHPGLFGCEARHPAALPGAADIPGVKAQGRGGMMAQRPHSSQHLKWFHDSDTFLHPYKLAELHLIMFLVIFRKLSPDVLQVKIMHAPLCNIVLFRDVPSKQKLHPFAG
jgi:hypothetical protein